MNMKKTLIESANPQITVSTYNSKQSNFNVNIKYLIQKQKKIEFDLYERIWLRLIQVIHLYLPSLIGNTNGQMAANS